MAKKKAKKKGRVVAAAASMSGGGELGEKAPLSKAIEEAMAAATYACLEDGITDPDKIREAKLEAREKVKAEANKSS